MITVGSFGGQVCVIIDRSHQRSLLSLGVISTVWTDRELKSGAHDYPRGTSQKLIWTLGYLFNHVVHPQKGTIYARIKARRVNSK